jgi:hypothetical protein
MLTQAPLPRWAGLLRALLRDPGKDADLAAPWRRVGELADCLSRSAWSLALIALWRKGRASDSLLTVWLPDYFCNSSLDPLRQTGARLVFYPLAPDMVPDMTACRALSASCSIDIFVMVHYFGQASAAGPARDFCRHTGAWLVEDAAHVLRPVPGIGESGDFVLYSPHKHLPMPDGAVLVVRPDGPAMLGPDGLETFGPTTNWPTRLRDVQQCMGSAIRDSGFRSLVWLAKRVLQKLGIGSGRAAAIPFVEGLEPGATVSTPVIAPQMSTLARRLAAGALSELADVARQRQRRQLLWDFLLIGADDSLPNAMVVANRARGRDWTPYLSAYRTVAGPASETYAKWQTAGLPVSPWPDLPPEVTANQENHASALTWRQTRFFLPVHQTLGARTMLQRCNPLRLRQSPEACLRLVWDEASPAQWAQWMVQAGRSNLLQSWAYGAAKADDSGWRVKRGVFHDDDGPIAFVQVLQKRVAGVLLASRINRGPLTLRPLGNEEQRAIWTALARHAGLWRGAVLSAAPELGLSGANLALMASLGFRQFSPRAWESAWLNLAPDLPVLRKGLDGKWRNMLNFAEKAGLTLEARNDDQAFEWILARYRELISEKGFSGSPISLLRSLRQHLPVDGQPIILRANHRNEAVAGICLVCHGAAATYLLGWNGNEGRKLKANQYLLWQAVVTLKQAGIRWFDLGGIDENLTPGISAFKSGLGGEQYELVGEYWKW